MKPFNLELAKQGKKVVTINEVSPEQLTFFETESGIIIYGVINKMIRAWTSDGKSFDSAKFNLFMATEKKTVYIAVSNDEFGGAMRLTTNACFSEDELQTYSAKGTVMSEPHQIVSFEIEV